MNRLPRSLRLALAIALAALAPALAGCFGSPSPNPTSTANSTPSPSATAVGSAQAVTGELLAEQTVDAPNPDTGGTLTVGIRSLTVEGDVMTLRWTLGWSSDDPGAPDAAKLYELGVGDLPAVIDGANLTMYWPFCEQGSWQGDNIAMIQCRESPILSPDDVSTRVPNGGSIEAWAVFPAVADGVETVDVQMPEGLPGFTRVTVTRAE